jgi:hypothetical protein
METYLAKHQKPRPAAVPKEAIAKLNRYNKNPLHKKAQDLAGMNQAKQDLSLTQARTEWAQELDRLQGTHYGPAHIADRIRMLRSAVKYQPARGSALRSAIIPTQHM